MRSPCTHGMRFQMMDRIRYNSNTNRAHGIHRADIAESGTLTRFLNSWNTLALQHHKSWTSDVVHKFKTSNYAADFFKEWIRHYMVVSRGRGELNERSVNTEADDCFGTFGDFSLLMPLLVSMASKSITMRRLCVSNCLQNHNYG